MGAADRSKRRDTLWKKAILHFSFCFTAGVLSGLSPTGSAVFPVPDTTTRAPVRSEDATPPVEKIVDFRRGLVHREPTPIEPDSALPRPDAGMQGRTDDGSDPSDGEVKAHQALLILVTTTSSGDPFKAATLQRLAQTLKLVPPPLLWVVVEAQQEAQRTAAMLRGTGVMYRHLAVNQNFTDAAAETDYQRNYALNHIEHHRLDGLVHFADLDSVYDLQFFDEIRDIESFGTWPVASVSTNRRRVRIEAPVCESSEVLGWHLTDPPESGHARVANKRISSFAFNSSVLWDPERWGRPSSLPGASQDSIKFVQRLVLEDGIKLMAFPRDCSSIRVWHLHIPRTLFPGYLSSSDPNQTYHR